MTPEQMVQIWDKKQTNLTFLQYQVLEVLSDGELHHGLSIASRLLNRKSHLSGMRVCMSLVYRRLVEKEISYTCVGERVFRCAAQFSITPAGREVLEHAQQWVREVTNSFPSVS
jgi:DNA-binding MarR family transcriptional regulator